LLLASGLAVSRFRGLAAKETSSIDVVIIVPTDRETS
jgi:hypothetical protein